MEQKLEKIWVTKYALTEGIFTIYIEHTDIDRSISLPDEQHFHGYARKGEWHRTEEEAKAKAEEMRIKKIASLKKQIKKLEEMKF